MIGIAESEFYPHISLVGTLGWSSQDLNNLFVKDSFRGTAGPSFRWNILNYCRLRNNVRFQEALFQELVTSYQQTALSAAGEAENAIVFFLKSQERVRALNASAAAWRDGTNLLETQYGGQMIDYTLVGFFAQNLLEQQDEAAQAQGDVATGAGGDLSRDRRRLADSTRRRCRRAARLRFRNAYRRRPSSSCHWVCRSPSRRWSRRRPRI